MGKGICCRLAATMRRIPPALDLASALFGLEHFRLELVAFEQLVELGAVAFRKLPRLAHAAAGDSQDANQGFALETAPRLLLRSDLPGPLLPLLFAQRRRD